MSLTALSYLLIIVEESKMNTTEIQERNIEFIQDFISRHGIKHSFEELMGMNSLYINFEGWTFRVFTILIGKSMEDVIDSHGNVAGTKTVSTQKKFNIYNYRKKKIDQALNGEAVIEIREDFIRFVYYWNELKLIKEFNAMEESVRAAYSLAESSEITSLKVR
jgi:hypothetical protein